MVRQIWLHFLLCFAVLQFLSCGGSGNNGQSGDSGPRINQQVTMLDSGGNPIVKATLWVPTNATSRTQLTDPSGNTCDSPLSNASDFACTNSSGVALFGCQQGTNLNLNVAFQGALIHSFVLPCSGDAATETVTGFTNPP